MPPCSAPEAVGSAPGLPVSMPRPPPGWRAAVEWGPPSATMTGPTWSRGRKQGERAPPGAPGVWSRLRTLPREAVKAGLCVLQAPAHAPWSHWASYTEHKVNDKIIRISRSNHRALNLKHGALLSMGHLIQATVLCSTTRSQRSAPKCLPLTRPLHGHFLLASWKSPLCLQQKGLAHWLSVTIAGFLRASFVTSCLHPLPPHPLPPQPLPQLCQSTYTLLLLFASSRLPVLSFAQSSFLVPPASF